ncbi:unnamed protein product, partial [Rotaria sp. Silwood1]
MLLVRVNSQLCHGVPQYDQCSTNSACGCFHMAGAIETGICVFDLMDCSELVPCDRTNNRCYEPEHRCVHHPQCHTLPVCYPVPRYNKKVCPPITIPLRAPAIDIDPNAKWAQNGLTVAGGNGQGTGINQLSGPWGLYVDDDQSVYVADRGNHRIVEWKYGATTGQVVAGGNGHGSGAHQLNDPVDVIVDKERDSLIISDYVNRRVVRWPRRNGTSGETIISNIACVGLTMDENGSLYVNDEGRAEVRRYRRGESQGTVVVGGNGEGNRLDQLPGPQYVFVDRDHSVYVSDLGNQRVMKWMEGAKQGVVVAGGHEAG